ncbi:podocan-like protein 1 isoform X2 [Pleurodeles waltl]|uniref:podocan-like protein 1 isoform X2 n=1 Tax=Pleurodeles waltl TaxID=8319 RepID=UPI00370988A1
MVTCTSLLIFLLEIPSFLLLGSHHDEEPHWFPHPGTSITSRNHITRCPANCTCALPESVDCSGVNLLTFPRNISNSVQHLFLQNNQLEEIPYEELSRLSSLKTLNLHNNHLLSEGLPNEEFQLLENLQYIYLGNNKLTVAPRFLPTTLRIADLAANMLTKIYPLTLGEKPFLRSVYLHNNQLSDKGLPSNAFNGSEYINTLILSNNHLSQVPVNMPPSLIRLHLQNNRISRIPKGALSSQLELRELHLQNNNLSSHGLDPATFSKLKGLEYLDLSSNQLTEIPSGLPPNLVILHLGKNLITSIPETVVSGIRNLEYLLLQNNRLSAGRVHVDAFLNMRNLHTLHLYNNQLDHVPPSLPKRARSLMILHNRISEIRLNDFAATYHILELNLSYNSLYSARIHRLAFRKLRKLENLDMSGNFLTFIPSGLPLSLEVLTLQKNQINSLSPETLANLTQMRELNLAHNRLQVGAITPGTWQQLQRLKTLDLGSNELSYVPPDLPESLECLYLQNNRISSVSPEAFHSTPNLRVLFLRSNRLTVASTPQASFLDLKYLEVVDTTGNPEPINIPRSSQLLKLQNSTSGT